MGKAGRFACVFTPMALTIASLICLIIVGLGGTNKNNSTYNNLYFFRANTTNIDIDPSLIDLPSNPITDKIIDAATPTVKQALDVKDIYHISLWNYCSGDSAKNSTGGATDAIDYCSPHQNQFWFNPVEVWGLNNTATDKLLSDELRSGLNTYKTVAKWMFIAYIAALITTIVEILVGFLALFSRLGSMATTIVSCVSSLFIIAFALSATILYSTLAGTFNTALNKYNIEGSLGKNIYVATWLGVAFSFAAGLFWLISSCCCSGRSDKIKGYGDEGKKKKGKRGSGGAVGGLGYGGWGNRGRGEYERMGGDFEGGLGYGKGGHQMGNLGGGQQQRGTAYEPFRHDGTRNV